MEVVRAVEATQEASLARHALTMFRDNLGLDDFGELMISLPWADFPRLSEALPRMASASVQDAWTGLNGLPLLRQSCNFVRSAAHNFARLTGRPLGGQPILDFGCGYGRLARLMYYFTDPENLFGVNPWDRSIALCHECGLGENFRLSEYLPDSLPLPRQDFAFIYAFSVFTHLSRHAALQALDVCRRYIAADGVMALTIRPVEYWDLPASIHGVADPAPLRRQHRREGFAFYPLATSPAEVTYGNTSMTARWIADNAPGWSVAAFDRSLDDAYQLYVFLRPR